MIQSTSATMQQQQQAHPSSTIEAITASLSDNKVHLLLAASGSVATIKLPLIVKTLSSRYCQAQPQQEQQQSQGDSTTTTTSSTTTPSALSIRVLLTTSAARFLAGQSAEQPPLNTLLDIPGVDGIYLDEDEWREPWRRGNAILHIELRRWADMLVVAPLSANTMAKIVGGFADGILTSVVRAWDARGELDSDVVRGGGGSGGDGDGGGGQGTAAATGGSSSSSSSGQLRARKTKKKRIIVAPAMNTAMWRHPVTAKQLRVLEEEWGVADAKKKKKKSYQETAAFAGSSSAKQSSNNNNITGLESSEEVDRGDKEKSDDGWFEVLRPQHKILACGDIGDGAMMEWTDIVAVIEDRLGLEALLPRDTAR